jgi:cell division transport system ATP-binding protein
VVTLEHIGKRYGDGAQVLSDISLTLDPGGFHFLTGASGAGKTALLRIIHLADRPTAGRMSLFGTDPLTLGRDARAALRRRIGTVFQDLRLIDDLSAHDNVALPLRIGGLAESQVATAVPELLAWIGAPDRQNAPVAELSAGERRRVAIARAIVARPELLIADEPASDLDDDGAMALLHLFERIHRLGTTVLVATHDIEFVRQRPYRHFHLEGGALPEGGGAPR